MKVLSRSITTVDRVDFRNSVFGSEFDFAVNLILAIFLVFLCFLLFFLFLVYLFIYFCKYIIYCSHFIILILENDENMYTATEKFTDMAWFSHDCLKSKTKAFAEPITSVSQVPFLANHQLMKFTE